MTRIPGAVPRHKRVNARLSTRYGGAPLSQRDSARCLAVPDLQRTTTPGIAFATCCAAPGTILPASPPIPQRAGAGVGLRAFGELAVEFGRERPVRRDA